MKTQLLTVKIFLCAFLFFACEHLQAQWQKTAGPPGMNVNVFFANNNILFAGTTPKGVFKSGDNGITWSAANGGIEERNVFSLTALNGFLFAGTDMGVYRSSDNGATWQAANSGIEQKFVVSFTAASGFLFAGCIGGLYKSADNGSTWTDANGSALTSSTIHDITFSFGHLTVISDNLIFYSYDNGDSWLYNYRSPFILSSDPFFLTTGDSVLLANGTGVYRSIDGGISWGNFVAIDLQTQICGMVKNNNTIYAGSKTGVYTSTNFGKSWTHTAATGLRSTPVFINHF
ncbi:MAG TPA: hypothetical protein PL045_08070, partial [Chitinophagaceae bacterium]|nr:hypothetical protein [Chitinophagaceae bacterium]